MSLQTWKSEFYPHDASAFASEGDELEAINHSLKKWEGLRPENLAKHNVEVARHFMLDFWRVEGQDGLLGIDASSCSLCVHHDERCEECALFKVHDRSCYADNNTYTSPWHLWSADQDPEPMINLIKEARVIYLKNGE